MKIGIDLNDTLRAFSEQLEYTVNKYHKYGKPGEHFDIEKNPIEYFDYIDYFGFKSKREYHEFLYQEASLEVFGHANEVIDNMTNDFNRFYMDLEDDEEHEVYIISREVDYSIPSTFYFLSKTKNKCKNIIFKHNYDEQWEDMDLIITTNPELIKIKPKGKKVIKVETTYNKDMDCDYDLTNIQKFFKDELFRNNILKKL